MRLMKVLSAGAACLTAVLLVGGCQDQGDDVNVAFGGIGPVPGTISQAVTEGGPNPREQTVNLSNVGNCDLSFTVTTTTTDGNAWLSTAPTSGIVGAGTSSAINVNIDVVTPALLPGSYTGTVNIAGTCVDNGAVAAGSPVRISVNLTVTPVGAAMTVDNTVLEQDVASLADTWSTMSSDRQPEARIAHSAVWTGRRMIVWGGNELGGIINVLDTGGLYDPVLDQWSDTAMTSAPSARRDHTAIWTGSKMIVWGGYTSPLLTNTGAVYDPGTNTWTPMSTTNAPSARRYHGAVWTGSKMIVWGGNDTNVSQEAVDTGGAYDPATDTWTSLSTSGSPSARAFHTMVWTGRYVLIWGGMPHGGGATNTGSRYDPVADAWFPMTTEGAPPAAGSSATAWTGTRLVVWGGFGAAGAVTPVDTGGLYDPERDEWTSTTQTGAPDGRVNLKSVWTGNRLVIWGGGLLDTGGVYDPVADSWSPTSTTGAPAGSSGHKMVWTGTQMLVFGASAVPGGIYQ